MNSHDRFLWYCHFVLLILRESVTAPPPSYNKAYFHGKILRDENIPTKPMFPPNQPIPVFGLNKSHANQLKMNHRLQGRGWWDHIVNLFTGVKDHSEASKRSAQQEIRYWLRSQRDNGWIEITKKSFEQNSRDAIFLNWNPSTSTKILIHGFSPGDGTSEEKIKAQKMYAIAKALASQKGKFGAPNVIVVDWTSLSTEEYMYYYEAKDSTRYAIETIAYFLLKLDARFLIGRRWNDVHLIGFSLGAHVAGGVGLKIKSAKGVKIGRITGLDPAGVDYHDNGAPVADLTNVLDSTDADFVDVIHCNGGFWQTGKFGTPVECGSVDFYPNGGVTQKNCAYTDVGCSHSKCPVIFEASITSFYIACPCESWKEFTAGSCWCNEVTGTFFGARTRLNATGRHYLNWG